MRRRTWSSRLMLDISSFTALRVATYAATSSDRDAIKRAFHDLPLVGEIEHAPENLEFPIDARYFKLYGVARRDVCGNEFRSGRDQAGVPRPSTRRRD